MNAVVGGRRSPRLQVELKPRSMLASEADKGNIEWASVE